MSNKLRFMHIRYSLPSPDKLEELPLCLLYKKLLPFGIKKYQTFANALKVLYNTYSHMPVHKYTPILKEFHDFHSNAEKIQKS